MHHGGVAPLVTPRTLPTDPLSLAALRSGAPVAPAVEVARLLDAIPWFLADRARDASAGAGALVVGGSMKVAAATALAVLAAAGVAVLDRTVLAPAPVAGESDRVARAEARVKELEERVASLQKARDEARLAPAPVAVAAGPKGGAGAPMDGGTAAGDPAALEAAIAAAEAAKLDAAAKARAPRIAVAGAEELLKSVDWGAIGTNMSAMTPLIARFAQKYAEDGTIDGEAAGQIQVHNGPLVTAALAAGARLKLEPNTAFTHPAFMVNAIAATLEAARLPLAEAQLAALGELAARYTAELGRLASATDPDAWVLARLVDESELRERFFVEAFGLLSVEQRGALTQPYAKDRLQVDIFSAGLMWLPHAQALPFQGREDLNALFETSMTQVLKLGPSDKAAFHEAVVEWASGLPPAWFEGEPDPLDAKGFVRVQRVHEAARRTVTLLQRWVDRTRPDEAGLKRLRAISATLVPVKGPAPK